LFGTMGRDARTADVNTYSSQFGQDAFLDRTIFRGFAGGVFVDVGAHDGEQFSNSVFFERERGWRGLCLEPNPVVFQRLRHARRAECLQYCAAAQPGTVDFVQVSGASEMLSGMVATYGADHAARRERAITADGGAQTIIAVPAVRLRDILAERRIAEVHFLSIDTEGGELAVLEGIDFAATLVHAIAVENNYRARELAVFLEQRGFVPLARLAVDDIYLNRRSPFFSPVLTRKVKLLRAAGWIERRLRRLGLFTNRPARFPFKRPT
jgi:FkbM family methyltransferase